jgi:AcrR family transcriptional regulator
VLAPLAPIPEHVHNRARSGEPPLPAAARSRPPAPESLRERNKREKRARIQRAARELFERKGFEAATARAIAARARVGLGTLFLYARDKRDLLFLVFADESQRLFAEAERALAARPRAGLVDALMELFGRFLAFYAERPALAAALLREFFFRPYEPERLGALSLAYAERVAALVERARARGELRADVPAALAAHALFAHYAYWTQAWLGSGLVTRAQAEARLREALALQIDGLRPAPGPRRRR